MLNEFLAVVEKHKLFKPNDKLLVAVSGGVDSMVLLDLLKKGEFNVTVAHCNFKLRGADSDGDEKFVKDTSENLGFNCLTESFDTKKYATDNSISTQMAARELRYTWFDELMDENNFKYLLTAHHLNDSLETSIFNFTKGTGIAGLRGILVKKDKLVRPMLEFTKEEVVDYAEQNNMKWREDVSNSSIDYKRNFIRKKVVPLLKEVNPSLESSFLLTAKRLQSLESLLEKQILEFKRAFELEGDHIFIRKAQFQKQEWVVMESVLKEYGFNHYHLQSTLDILNDDVPSGKQFESHTHSMNVDREHIILSPKFQNEDVLVEIGEEEEGTLNGVIVGGKVSDDLSYSIDPQVAKLDFDLLKFPLRLRYWREGDRFQPLGMKGKKKLSDFMIDAKIPLNLKKRVMVLLSENKIVWVVGHRIDERFKITPDTKKAYSLEITNDQSI
ncbi:tRNA lysidine(34) synthetase TilS [Fulvivirga sp.]|uniref:tRNA lysidine(34) synthetase TilS n=1 Tax=Fulvivirga sp. TaxID=1931237 RepID=UPI0032EF3DF9